MARQDMPVSIDASYLGMPTSIDEFDTENLEYFRHAAAHDFHLQQCSNCHLIRYPPMTGCPWCASRNAQWRQVEGSGVVVSYTEVHHAIQPAFAPFLPYLVLLVELETQRGHPTEHEALRVIGNLVDPSGALASRDQVEKVGIGTIVRMVFSDIADGLSLPQWTIDPSAAQPRPWRYPGEVRSENLEQSEC